MTTPPPGDRADDPDKPDSTDGPTGESAAQAAAFRRALDAQAETEDPGQPPIPTAPNDATTPLEHAEIREAYGDEPAESVTVPANPQTRIPAWAPQVHTLPPPETSAAADTAPLATDPVPAQQTDDPAEAPAADSGSDSARQPAGSGARRIRSRLPLTAAICVFVIALTALALAFAETRGSPKGPSPLSLPSATIVNQVPVSSSGPAATGASCAAHRPSSSCAATPDPSAASAAASAPPSSASPAAQATSPTPVGSSTSPASSPSAAQLDTTNLALHRSVTASGYTQTYVPANAVDGDTGSYWESTDNAFPQWFRIDLGSVTAISAVTIALPPSASWGTRTQTIQIQGSANGLDYSTIESAAGYTFNPATGNKVTIGLPSGASARYLQLDFTANTGWPAGQMSELEVFG